MAGVAVPAADFFAHSNCQSECCDGQILNDCNTVNNGASDHAVKQNLLQRKIEITQTFTCTC